MTHYSLNKEDIIKQIPHGASMSLLNGVTAINEKEIFCEAMSHQNSKNPLLFEGQLSALTLAEYAGQAVALHRHYFMRYSQDTETPKEGYLAALKNVRLFIGTLSDIDMPLQITAGCIFLDANKALYEFKVSAADKLLATGEMIVAEDE